MSDNNGLWAAARYGNIVVLRFMLSRGVDINSADSYGKTALIRASHGGHIQAVNLLLEHGAEVNRTDKYKQTALMCAIKQSLNCWEQRERYNETVKALVSAGADMHLRDAQGRTALLLAAMEGSTEAV